MVGQTCYVACSVRVYKNRRNGWTSNGNSPVFHHSVNTPLTKPVKGVQALLHGFQKDGILFIFWPFIEAALGRDSRVIAEELRVSTFYPKLVPISKYRRRKPALGLMLVVAILVGVVHMFGWSYYTPSRTERILWRFSSFSILVVSIIFYGMVVITDDKPQVNPLEGMPGPFRYLFWVSLAVYVLGRVGVLVLASLSLRALPPEAYKSIYWIGLIPHL
jgi:hypothetical protein